MFLKTVIETVY